MVKTLQYGFFIDGKAPKSRIYRDKGSVLVSSLNVQNCRPISVNSMGKVSRFIRDVKLIVAECKGVPHLAETLAVGGKHSPVLRPAEGVDQPFSRDEQIFFKICIENDYIIVVCIEWLRVYFMEINVPQVSEKSDRRSFTQVKILSDAGDQEIGGVVVKIVQEFLGAVR